MPYALSPNHGALTAHLATRNSHPATRNASPHRLPQKFPQFPQRLRIDYIILFQPSPAGLTHPVAQVIKAIRAVGIRIDGYQNPFGFGDMTVGVI